MPSVTAAPDDIREWAERVIAEKFNRLRLADPELRLAWLLAGDLSQSGHEVSWKARVTNQEQRAATPDCPDVVITINAGVWQSVGSDETREAILAEALYSVRPEWVRSTSNDVKTDALGRPKVKLKRPDVWIQGYKEIAGWYGVQAPLTHAVACAAAALEQQVMGFLGSASPSEPPGGRSTWKGEWAFKGKAGPAVVKDTLESLISVGHTEEEARHQINRALATGRVFDSVADLIDAIYRLPQEETPQSGDSTPVDSAHPGPDAELADFCREANEAKGRADCPRCGGSGGGEDPAQKCPGCDGAGWVDAWRVLPVSELVKHGLSENVASILSDTHGIDTLGELFDSAEAGDLAEDAQSLSDDEVDEVLAAKRRWQARESAGDMTVLGALPGYATDPETGSVDPSAYQEMTADDDQVEDEKPAEWTGPKADTPVGIALPGLDKLKGSLITQLNWNGLGKAGDLGRFISGHTIDELAAKVGVTRSQASAIVEAFNDFDPDMELWTSAKKPARKPRKAKAAASDDWRGLAVTSLKVPGPVHGKLLDAGVKTLGELAEILDNTAYTAQALAKRFRVSTLDLDDVARALKAIASPCPHCKGDPKTICPACGALARPSEKAERPAAKTKPRSRKTAGPGQAVAS